VKRTHPSYDLIRTAYDDLHARRFEERLQRADRDEQAVFADKLTTAWHTLAKGFIAQVGCLRGSKMLEVGCGYGSLSVFVAQQKAVVSGVDISATAVRLSRRNAELAGVDATFTQANAVALPFQDGAFDLVVCCDTLEHVPEYRVAVNELARVTRVGGHLIVTTPNVINPRGIYLLATSGQPVENPFLYWTMTRLLVRRGLAIVSTRVRDFLGAQNRVARAVERMVSMTPLKVLGLRVGVLAKKIL